MPCRNGQKANEIFFEFPVSTFFSFFFTDQSEREDTQLL